MATVLDKVPRYVFVRLSCSSCNTVFSNIGLMSFATVFPKLMNILSLFLFVPYFVYIYIYLIIWTVLLGVLLFAPSLAHSVVFSFLVQSACNLSSRQRLEVYNFFVNLLGIQRYFYSSMQLATCLRSRRLCGFQSVVV